MKGKKRPNPVARLLKRLQAIENDQIVSDHAFVAAFASLRDMHRKIDALTLEVEALKKRKKR